MEFSISSVIFCAESELLFARLFTSSATTAKPLPVSPALAASTAAFSASRLVWKEISSIVLIMPPISWEALEISSIASFRSAIFSLQISSCLAASVEQLLASSASAEVRSTWPDSSWMLADNSSTADACWIAPSESTSASEAIVLDSFDTCPDM